MYNVLNRIFSGKNDEEIHRDFVKFSKGVFDNRYLVEGKKQKDKWAIKTSAEFGNFFVRAGLERAPEELEVKGVIVSTMALKDEVSFEIEKVKQFQGVKQIVVNTVVKTQEILDLMDKYPKAFFGLSFKIDGFELKVKAKSPKSGKPSKKDEEGPKADFCSLKTNDKRIIEDLFFGIGDFKEVKIRHVIEINEIELPSGEEDPVKIRENAVRKGKIRRIIRVDEREEEKEVDFAA